MQLKQTERVLGFKHNLDNTQVVETLQKFIDCKRLKQANWDGQVLENIINKCKEIQESGEKKDVDTDKNGTSAPEKEGQRTRSDSNKGGLLCGKKRK